LDCTPKKRINVKASNRNGGRIQFNNLDEFALQKALLRRGFSAFEVA
jgi:hypothetical protein